MSDRPPIMTSGAYLTKRRGVSGLSLREVAALFAGRFKPAPLGRRAMIDALERWLQLAELDAAPLFGDHPAQLTECFTFDPAIYRQLLDLQLSGFNAGLPVPQICRSCACSFFDPCIGPAGVCGWAKPDLCTECAGTASAVDVSALTIHPIIEEPVR